MKNEFEWTIQQGALYREVHYCTKILKYIVFSCLLKDSFGMIEGIFDV